MWPVTSDAGLVQPAPTSAGVRNRSNASPRARPFTAMVLSAPAGTTRIKCTFIYNVSAN